MQKFDFVIHGAGMIGSATAIGLAQLGYSVALIEANAPKPFKANQPLDLRVSALSFGTERILDRLEAWSWIKQQRLRTYTDIEVFEGNSTELCFSAKEAGIPYLGHFVENRLVQLGLWEQFKHHDNLQLWVGNPVETLQWEEDCVRIQLGQGETLEAKWVIGADGMKSFIREQAGIASTGKQYEQEALVASVRLKQPRQHASWQEFTARGPLGFLPLAGDEASLVWYETSERVAQLKMLPEDVLAHEIMKTFPKRLGEIEVINKGSFQLVRQHAKEYVGHRTLLIGDAAHSIHPMAGQGVNLGFKDLKVLLELLEKAKIKGQDPLSADVMKRYHQKRYYDNLMMMSFIEVLYKGFQVELSLVQKLRQASFFCASHSGPIKNQVLKYAVGLA